MTHSHEPPSDSSIRGRHSEEARSQIISPQHVGQERECSLFSLRSHPEGTTENWEISFVTLTYFCSITMGNSGKKKKKEKPNITTQQKALPLRWPVSFNYRNNNYIINKVPHHLTSHEMMLTDSRKGCGGKHKMCQVITTLSSTHTQMEKKKRGQA